ncbi:MAG: type II secretion system protein GspD, partial [Alkalispirochaeta sp.]
ASPALSGRRRLGAQRRRPRGAVMIEDDLPAGAILSATGAPRDAVLREVADFLNLSLVIAGDLTSTVSSLEICAPDHEALPRRVAMALDVRLYRENDTLYVADGFDSGALSPFFHTRFLSIAERYQEALTAALATVRDLSISATTDRGILISGMEESLSTAEELAEVLRSSRRDLRLFEYRPRTGDAAAIVEALSFEFEQTELRVLRGREAILGWVAPDRVEALHAAARRWDRGDSRHRYRCRFADPQEILDFVSAHYADSQAAVTADGTAITLVGPPATHAAVQQYLRDVDQPPRQLRFDLCIIQYQSGQAVQHGVDFFAEHTPEVAVHAAPITGSGGFSGVLELQFDVISRLGYQAAVAISDELTENRAQLVLDTSLKAVHRETARLENSSTFRYRDVLGEEDESSWRSVVREINSGLAVEVTGFLHDDRSITVDIRVELSRQGADVSRNGNPPPTSQRVVESTVRVHPGEPVIIGGLLQQEESSSEHRFPLLGRIPVLRRIINRYDHHSEENELVLYLSAFPEVPPTAEIHVQRQIQRLNELVRGGNR